MIIPLLQTIARPLFGTFEEEEFKKFLRMGAIFALIIGCYWTMRVLKDAVFANLVDATQLPWAKTASLICLFPLVIFYTKLFDRYSRENMLYILSSAYGVLTIVFALLLLMLQAPSDVIATRTGLFWFATKALGYAWYVFVESYGSLVVALFWAFASDITMPESAKKGYPLIVAIGQMGGIVGPKFISALPRALHFETSAISVFVCSLATLLIIVMVRYLLTATPKSLLISFHGKNEAVKEKEQEPGFFEGLRLMLQHNYLLAIFAAIFIYEVIVTVFDYNFKVLAQTQYGTGRELDAYLGNYGSWVNIVSLICLLGGVSNITRILGVGTALILMPIIVGLALLGFISFENIEFLFWLMVGSKAINYALNGPAMKQLYIPTTHDVRFKSQAWIETFGSRGSKETGSIINMTLQPLKNTFGAELGRLYYIRLSGVLGFALVGFWFFVALFLGRTYKKAVDQNKVVC